MVSGRTIRGSLLAAGLAAGIWAVPAARAEHSPLIPEPGARLYQEFCAGCHGDEGKGNGPLTSRHNWWQIDAPDHSRKPRDLTRDWFLFGDGKTEIMRTIRNGSGGTAMTNFTPTLAESDVAALADVVLTLRGGMSNELIQRRFPERIPKSPVTPRHHRLVDPTSKP
jgi:mono/diheme cytochrome c family protein